LSSSDGTPRDAVVLIIILGWVRVLIAIAIRLPHLPVCTCWWLLLH